MQFYTLYDKKAAAYMTPQVYRSSADACRSIQMAMEEPKSMLSRFPAEFALYLVGHFDASTGAFTAASTGMPQLVLEVAALVPRPEVDNVR